MQRLVHRTDRHRLELRFKEHIRYITSNNPVLGYALYILHNAHENGPTETSMTLLHSAQKKNKRKNTLENYYIHYFYKHNMIIREQKQEDKIHYSN